MLRRIKIENFVLVKTCHIEFSDQFNIITGETGSGKSVLLSALELLLGGRADAEAIRHGEESARIEGEFHLADPAKLQALTDEYEIELSSKLIVRREMYRSGKHKTYINDHIVPAQLVRALAPHLIIHFDQESCLKLKSPSYALSLLDLCAENLNLKNIFHTKYTELLALQKQYAELQKQEAYKEIELEQLKRDITALSALQLEDLDDEELFTQYQQGVAHKKEEELCIKLSDALDGEQDGLLAKIFHVKQLAERLPVHIKETFLELISSSHAQIKEASYTLQRRNRANFLSNEALGKIEKRLSAFDSAKRKFHATHPKELLAVLDSKQKRQTELLLQNETMHQIDKEIEILREELDKTGAQLTAQRTQAAKNLTAKVQEHLQKLNMPHATFSIHLNSIERTASGDDSCTFFFTPNRGEKQVNVHTGASGGELARIFLALSTILSCKEQVNTLLFDEIDANIGGMTAKAVGTLLEEMSHARQILAITHFPQVAQYAHKHFALSKEVIDGRTLTSILFLSDAKEREQEHLRMSGQALCNRFF